MDSTGDIYIVTRTYDIYINMIMYVLIYIIYKMYMLHIYMCNNNKEKEAVNL